MDELNREEQEEGLMVVVVHDHLHDLQPRQCLNLLGIGTGGGVSTTYAIPAWQTNINMTVPQGSQVNRNGYRDDGYRGERGYYQSSYRARECYIERRDFEDRYGRLHVRNVRVCH